MLVVDVATPRPNHDSGSLRLHNLLKLLLRERCHVSFIADDGIDADPESQALSQLGVDVVQMPPVAWMRAHGGQLDAVILCRHHVAGHWLPLARSCAPAARIVFDTVDLHFLREQREAQLHGSARLQRRADATRAIELHLASMADATWVVSEFEHDLLRAELPDTELHVLSNIIDVAEPGNGFDDRHDLLFVGGHRHPPNVDAVWWLLRELFPRLRARLPQVRLHLIGADTPAELIAAAQAQPGVLLHGHVPVLEPFLWGCRIALAPLRFGAGVKGKINLSMAHGQPVVATACAIEGMHLRPGLDVMVADETDAFATAVADLYEDRAQWETLARNGLDNVRRHFSVSAAAAVLRQTLAFDAPVQPEHSRCE